jgi:hypothetical protein
MGRKVGFYKSWMDLSLGDMEKLNLEAFNAKLTGRKRAYLTLILVASAMLVLVFMDKLAAGLILVTGLWVIWNRNGKITKMEKRIFLTAVVLALFLATVGRVGAYMNAAGVWALIVIGVLIVIWRA